ncbi:DUF4465 domain-containing protein [Prevotella sp. P6B4]|uniref:DUF4465 domain-containing protein n=1 Tax=Prevotella sp. P6B4 TaxID=1410614 RepID=UPI000686FE94|nr:DUF4465 domain-containing protein [Prevotella sp. P6B4]
MKTNKFFGLAVLVCGFALSFTSCDNEDNPVNSFKTYTISFENQALNNDGYWCGDESGVKFSNWGADAYACNYVESGVSFPANYTPAYLSWTGYAISNRTATTYANMIPDQFNNTTGTAHSGNKYCVVYIFGETIDLNGGEPVWVNGFWYTNDAWTVDAILNGDGMTPGAFDATDWLKCTVTGTKADGTTASVDIDLAKDGEYVSEWKYCDLSSLGKVKDLSFTFDGSKKNSYGLTTPSYMCIDDLQIVK